MAMAGVGRPSDGHLGFFLVLISTSWQFNKQHVLPTAKHQEKMVALPLSYAAWEAILPNDKGVGPCLLENWSRAECLPHKFLPSKNEEGHDL